MSKKGHSANLTIPEHREVNRGTLRSIMRTAGLTIEQGAR